MFRASRSSEHQAVQIQSFSSRHRKSMMMKSQASLPAYLEEDNITQECKDLMSSLPRGNGWMVSYIYQYQGFWYPPGLLQGVLNCQKHFQAKDSDIILVTNPKSGTTWLKALVFALINRERFQDSGEHHPLLANNPHILIPFLEGIYHQIQDLSDMPSPRLFNSHISHFSLPESVKDSSCKIVYCCRNPKDMFVSLWHFGNKLRSKELGSYPIEDIVSGFCRGSTIGGPFWDHILGYWKLSRENPEKVLFLMYENMKEQPALQLKRIADFLGCLFTGEEEAKGMVDDIVRLCSFDTLSNLEVNKNGKLPNGIDSKTLFRKGETGGWRDTLTASMAEEIDRITEEKFRGSGLKFSC